MSPECLQTVVNCWILFDGGCLSLVPGPLLAFHCFYVLEVSGGTAALSHQPFNYQEADFALLSTEWKVMLLFRSAVVTSESLVHSSTGLGTVERTRTGKAECAVVTTVFLAQGLEIVSAAKALFIPLWPDSLRISLRFYSRER